jgi:hypothetical protein
MKSSGVWCAVSWIVVMVPLVWGFTHTVQSALKIFAAH